MPESEFLGYVGPAGLHDSEIVSVQRDSACLVVECLAEDGAQISLRFSGVEYCQPTSPIGMVLYSLTERRCSSPLRRFVFVNSEDDLPSWEVRAARLDWDADD